MELFEQQLLELLNKPIWSLQDRRDLLKLLENKDPELVKELIEKVSENDYSLPAELSEKILEKIHAETLVHTKTPVRRLWLKRSIAAAAVVLLAVMGSLWYFSGNSVTQKENLVTVSEVTDIEPGGNKAILVLDDGTQVILDETENGAISQQDNITIVKSEDGRLVYSKLTEASQIQPVRYNTISTPRGGQYQLTLSDGTRVWLNAESSLTYPTVFTGSERQVELKGEGYFEVAHRNEQPFLVITDDVRVKVLGTHFNINAYKEEASVKTTLLEGNVVVEAGGQTAGLKPGNQADYRLQTGKLQTIAKADVEQTVAWKNGYFLFADTDLQAVMRQISKWYDVDIRYEGKVPAYLYSGKVHRNTSLMNILDILNFTNLNIKLTGKTLIVSGQ